MSTDQTRPTDDQAGSRAHVQERETPADIDVDVIEARVIAAGDAWRAEAPASVAALIYDAGALFAEVRRLTAALAEAEAARDEAVAGYDAQVRHGRAHFERAERAETALREVKALVSTWSPRAARKILAVLARAEQAGDSAASPPVARLRPTTGTPRALGDDEPDDGDDVGGDGQDVEGDVGHADHWCRDTPTTAVAP